jgi:hypothetical protein
MTDQTDSMPTLLDNKSKRIYPVQIFADSLPVPEQLKEIVNNSSELYSTPTETVKTTIPYWNNELYYKPIYQRRCLPFKNIHVVYQGILLFTNTNMHRFEIYVNDIFKKTFYSNLIDPQDAFTEFQLKQTIPEKNWEGSIQYEDKINYEHRLKTFTNWSKNIQQKPKEMAEAGFFYTNCRDTVTCFWCGTILSNWLITDEAWNEHIRWSPNCPFIKMCKPVTNLIYSSNPFI